MNGNKEEEFNILDNMIKKTILFLGIVYCLYTLIYSFDKDKATKYLTENALSQSHCCCAWFTMRALQAGGCYVGIFPAWMYKYVLPFYKFTEIPSNGYCPKKGDVVVFENTDNHFWGHVAMYNGNQWISDFKQKSMFVYKESVPYKIYRFE